jgi:hypothetical protein
VPQISGKHYSLEANEFQVKSFQLTFNGDTCVFSTDSEKGKQQIACGTNKWIEQANNKKATPFPLEGRMETPTAIAASVGWLDDKTLLMTLRLMEGAHTNAFTFVFNDNYVTLKFHSSISEGNPKAPEKRADLKGSFAA